MKRLLLTALATVVHASIHAQTIKPDARMQQRALAYKLRQADELRTPPPVAMLKGARVQILPQDGMPCIVPDTKDIASIPNALLRRPGRPVAGQIPNAWKNHRRAENTTGK